MAGLSLTNGAEGIMCTPDGYLCEAGLRELPLMCSGRGTPGGDTLREDPLRLNYARVSCILKRFN